MKEGNIIEWNIVFCFQNVADRENTPKEVIFFLILWNFGPLQTS